MRHLSATLTIAVVLAGCGSDDDGPASESTATPSGAKADYIAQIDGVCQEMRTDQIEISSSAEKTVPAQAAALREIADVHRAGMKRIEALDAPADAAPVKEFTTTVTDNADVLDEAAEVLEAGDTGRSRELVASIGPSTEQAVAAIRSYGVRGCGQRN